MQPIAGTITDPRTTALLRTGSIPEPIIDRDPGDEHGESADTGLTATERKLLYGDDEPRTFVGPRLTGEEWSTLLRLLEFAESTGFLVPAERELIQRLRQSAI